MTTSPAGIAFIKAVEGCELEAYEDSPGKIWTIGWGHTGGVYPGMTITEEGAEAFLEQDLKTTETFVSRMVTVPLTQNQFDALVSFTFNEGTGRLMTSTLLKKLIRKDYQGAADEFLRWDKAHTPDGEVVTVPDLQERRAAERELFLTPD